MLGQLHEASPLHLELQFEIWYGFALSIPLQFDECNANAPREDLNFFVFFLLDVSGPHSVPDCICISFPFSIASLFSFALETELRSSRLSYLSTCTLATTAMIMSPWFCWLVTAEQGSGLFFM
jgi:hypothetical protein